MTVFVITPAVETMFAQLRAEAEAHPISFERMQRAAAAYQAGNRAVDPQNQLQTITLPFGWTLTYTIEHHRADVPCRHISVASPTVGSVPVPELMAMVLPYFGFVGALENMHTDIEKMRVGFAFEAIQPMSGTMNDLIARR